MAFEGVLTNLLIKDNKLRNQLYRKEQKLLEENRIISDQLRAILASLENEFIQKSYKKINASRATLANTINTMAWVGAVTLFFLIVFAYIIISDLTTQQNYRKQLETLNLENEELLRTKSMLMATVTHDLQTPLGSIVGFHDLIKKLGVTPRQSHYLANIKESANYILKLVNDLMDFSRLENNRITIEKLPFNMKNTIEAACRSLQPMAFDKDIDASGILNELGVNDAPFILMTMHRPATVASGDVKERARRRLSPLGFSSMRRKAPPGTGFSGIVPRFGSGSVGLPISTPCAWPKGLKRPPSLSRQSPRKRSSRFPSTSGLMRPFYGEWRVRG